MFSQTITETPLTTEIAESSFRTKADRRFQGDAVLLSLFRSIIEPRIKTDYTVSCKEWYPPRGSYDPYEELVIRDNEFLIFAIQDVEENDDTHCPFEDNKHYQAFEKVLSENNFAVNERVNNHFEKSGIKLRSFFNEERKSSIILVKNLGVKGYYYVCANVVGMISPCFRDEISDITKEEVEALISVKGNSAEPLMSFFQKVADTYDFREKYIMQSLKGFESKSYAVRLRSIENEIESVKSRLEDYLSRIEVEQRKKNELMSNAIGIRQAMGSGEESTELAEFFIRNKSMNIHEVCDNNISFDVSSFVENYDEDLAERMINNGNSVLYERARDGGKLNAHDAQKLFRAVFIDKKISLKFVARYRITDGARIIGLSDQSFGAQYNDAMPNPHIQYYHCIGGYETTMAEAIMNGDYTMAVSLCVASVGSLNFSDSTVMDRWMRTIYSERAGCNTKAFHLPTGEVVDVVGAVEWLKKEEENE